MACIHTPTFRNVFRNNKPVIYPNNKWVVGTVISLQYG
jgi:hypothetical protein